MSGEQRRNRNFVDALLSQTPSGPSLQSDASQSAVSITAAKRDLLVVPAMSVVSAVTLEVGQMTHDESIVLSHYIHCYVPLIPAASGADDLFASAYLPLALHCNAVRDAIVAVAAAQLY